MSINYGSQRPEYVRLYGESYVQKAEKAGWALSPPSGASRGFFISPGKAPGAALDPSLVPFVRVKKAPTLWQTVFKTAVTSGIAIAGGVLAASAVAPVLSTVVKSFATEGLTKLLTREVSSVDPYRVGVAVPTGGPVTDPSGPAVFDESGAVGLQAAYPSWGNGYGFRAWTPFNPWAGGLYGSPWRATPNWEVYQTAYTPWY